MPKQSSWEQIIEKTMPAVVTIVVSKSLKEIEKAIPHEFLPFFPFNAPKIKIPEDAIDAHGMVKVGSGSGSIVDSKGLIITNKHVVADKKAEYTVITSDNKKYQADILARDPVDDVAILKINERNLPVIELGDSNSLKLGQPVLAIGNALGLFKNTVSSGIISGLSRAISAPSVPGSSIVQEMRGLIQTDAAINPGNSGGPLLDNQGKIVGISTAIVYGAQNLSFAIPINTAKRDLEDFKNHGRIKRPLLGVRYITIDANLKEKLNLPVDYGALVIGDSLQQGAVVPNSPAEKAGIKERDIILECNNEPITAAKTLQDFLTDKEAGDYLLLKVLRNRREFEAKIVLAERK